MSNREDRPSPPYSAQAMPGKIELGNDGNQYISRPDKNGIYHWKRLWGMGETKSAVEYYSQFPQKPRIYDSEEVVRKLRAVARDLKKHGVPLLQLGWDSIWDFADYAADDAAQIIGSTFISGKNGEGGYSSKPVIYYTDHKLYWASISGKLYLNHDLRTHDVRVSKYEISKIYKTRKDIVIRIFREHFGRRFLWNGYQSAALCVQLLRKAKK